MYLQLFQGISCTPNLVESHANIAAQHAGALVDKQAAPEVVLSHLILLLPEVDLTHPIPATRVGITFLNLDFQCRDEFLN